MKWNRLFLPCLFFVGLLELSVPSESASQTLDLVRRPDGKFVVRGSGGTSGIDLASKNGVLIPFEHAAPFAFLLANTPRKVTFAALAPVTIDGELVLGNAGAGGWDTSRAAEYDVVHSLGGRATHPNCTRILISHVYGLVHGNCNLGTRVNFGAVMQHDADADILRNVVSVEAWGGPYDVTAVRVSGESNAFAVPNFRPHTIDDTSSPRFDIELNTELPPGQYSALVEFSAIHKGTQEETSQRFDVSAEILLSGDCNADGQRTPADLACVGQPVHRDAILAALNTLPGDLDGDGQVGFQDFLTLSENFGTEEHRYTAGNIDLRRGVEFADFLLLSSNYGKMPAAQTVPEPICAAPWILLLLAGTRRHIP